MSFDPLQTMLRTVGELSACSGLHDRYLTEWLGVMVTGKVIELSQSPDREDTYFLPPEHASLLTRRAGSNNMGVYTQEIPLLTCCAMEAVMEHPMGPFLYAVSLMHCMPVGLTDHGAGLGMMWGQENAEAQLREAGFEQIEMAEMAHDPFNLHYLCWVPTV